MEQDEIIEKLNLVPLPEEGGYYRQSWVSDFQLDGPNILSEYGESKPAGTAIYFLLINSYNGFSALHKLPTPETYHFYLGDPVELSLFYKNGKVRQLLLGSDIMSGENLQFTVPASVIQGSRIAGTGSWALLGTTMAPGFTERDFELSLRSKLLENYPDNRGLILSLTRETGDV